MPWLSCTTPDLTARRRVPGSALQAQYERWQPRAKYKKHLDPTLEDVKKLATSCRRAARVSLLAQSGRGRMHMPASRQLDPHGLAGQAQDRVWCELGAMLFRTGRSIASQGRSCACAHAGRLLLCDVTLTEGSLAGPTGSLQLDASHALP